MISDHAITTGHLLLKLNIISYYYYTDGQVSIIMVLSWYTNNINIDNDVNTMYKYNINEK